MTDDRHTVAFAWTRPPLTSNQRLHWAAKAKITAKVRAEAAEVFAQDRPAERVEVTLTWFVKDKRRRDADNLVPTLKALCDGLVDAGIVPDDTPEYMVKHMPVIKYNPDGVQVLVLEVREIT
jgi:Holliday junction resolvase RusA-like endonuclease